MIGFTPLNGDTVFWVFPGGQSAGTTIFRNTGTDFPNTPELRAARYGTIPILPGTEGPNPVRGEFPVYAEAIGLLTLAMNNAAKDPANEWHFHTGEATDLEVYDFAATRMPNGWANSAIKRKYFDQVIVPPVQTLAQILASHTVQEIWGALNSAGKSGISVLARPSLPVEIAKTLQILLSFKGTVNIGPARHGRFADLDTFLRANTKP